MQTLSNVFAGNLWLRLLNSNSYLALNHLWGWRCGPVVAHLPRIPEALFSMPTTVKKKKKKKIIFDSLRHDS
jgi:hypothetical protein